MRDADRFRLLGKYTTPRLKIGAVVTCEYRDCDVIIVGYSDARIPWPLGRRRGKSVRSLVVCGQLVEAVRRESNLAIQHWFGVSQWTVWHWRIALGVGRVTPGTSKLRSDYTNEPWAIRARKKASKRHSDPQVRQKISDSKRGKPVAPHVIEAMRQARIGKPLSAKTRAKMSAAHRARWNAK